MNLKAFLKLFNISNKNFAKEIGVSAVSLSRYIIGERVPEKKIINKIFRKTNGLVDANDFFIEKENNEDLSSSDIQDIDSILYNLRKGSRTHLAKAITLIESSLEKDKMGANLLLSKLKENNDSIRIGITGVPGVGKSTIIEALGKLLIEGNNKVAVLAVDPSSKQSGGSILGDKTRMEKLSVNRNAYVRPSPNQGHLGGVAKKTFHSIRCLEEFGFNIIFVETMGVGQAETSVYDMVDIFLVLLLPTGGDELQGIKKGIIELADLIVVNKADGGLIKQAESTKNEYTNASQMTSDSRIDLKPNIFTCSAIENKGIKEMWNFILKFIKTSKDKKIFYKTRNEQRLKNLWSDVDLNISEFMDKNFKKKDYVKDLIKKTEKNEVSLTEASKIIYEYLTKKRFD
jgi:LAO/AO transport system kinase